MKPAALLPLAVSSGRSGQLHQVGQVQAATGRGDQPEHIALQRCAAHEPAQLAGHLRAQDRRVRRHRQYPDDRRVTQRVAVGHVVRDGRMRPGAHDDLQSGRRSLRQHGGDAVRLRPGHRAPVLVEPVDDEHEPPAPLGGPAQQPEQPGLAGGLGQQRRHRLVQQVGELLDEHVDERRAVALPGEPGGDEERDDPHADRRGPA
ncbi:hypothetical protein [Dactylosporangium sp. NPDC005555]|uniref:hypothetical protein n=1 Tax=Dactylosporangium sp. NPDC005555 TaxID=3154889 RepID=UPI0033A494C3